MDNDRTNHLLREAKLIFDEAVKLDNSQSLNDAVDKYSKGISTLATAFQLMDETHKRYDDTKIFLSYYEERLEQLKDECNFNKPGQVREVKEGSTGHGYEQVFAQCCNIKLKEITIDHPYLTTVSQVENLVRFCELIVLRAKNLKKIHLITCNKSKKREPSLKILEESLRERGIELDYTFSCNVHYRQFIFDNGWDMFSGIGLDYFESIKNHDYTNKLGAFELNFRKCKPGRIVIMRPKVSLENNGDAALEKLLYGQAATIQRACDYDASGHWNDALHEYKKGVKILSAISSSISKDHKRYEQVKDRLPMYITRIELLEKMCYNEQNQEVRKIEEDTCGHGYDNVFKKCFNSKLSKVVVYESIQTEFQKENFIRFCELVVLMSRQLKTIVLHTDQDSETLFDESFESLKTSLKERNINFGVNYSNDGISNEIHGQLNFYAMKDQKSAFGGNKEPLWAARRVQSKGRKQIALVHLKSGFVRKVNEDELRNCGVTLGDFVSADCFDGVNWTNYSRVDIPNITPNVVGDVAYVDNIAATSATINGLSMFVSDFFPPVYCRHPAAPEVDRIYTIRINLREYPIVSNNNKKINLEGQVSPNSIDLPQQVHQATRSGPPSSIGSFPLPPNTIHNKAAFASPVPAPEPIPVSLSPVPDTEDGVKRLFWAGMKEFQRNGQYHFVCVLIGTEQIVKTRLNETEVELGDFFNASIVDGELCEFEEGFAPAGWEVEVAKPERNLALITNVISIAENDGNNCLLRNDTLGLSVSETPGLRGKYTHGVYLNYPYLQTGDETILFKASDPKRVRENFKAVVIGYTETAQRRTHDILIIEKDVKCQFTDESRPLKLPNLHFFEGEFEEINEGWSCVTYVREVKPQVVCSTMNGRGFSLNFENP